MGPWRIFYADGSTYCSPDAAEQDDPNGPPEQAPGWGVQAIAEADAMVGVSIHRGVDFYCYDLAAFGGWGGVDSFGLAQYLGAPGMKVVKLGALMDTERYRLLLARVRADPRLPSKSARYPWEAPMPEGAT